MPSPLSIDTRDGVAWLGLVPFTMTGVMLRGTPTVPWLSAFTEMNLRTYVTMNGKPGVWFLRMDASRASTRHTRRRRRRWNRLLHFAKRQDVIGWRAVRA